MFASSLKHIIYIVNLEWPWTGIQSHKNSVWISSNCDQFSAPVRSDRLAYARLTLRAPHDMLVDTVRKLRTVGKRLRKKMIKKEQWPIN